MSVSRPVDRIAGAIERNRRRLWAVCYRMTGLRTDADDLSQEATARALERAHQQSGDDPTGWLIKLTARVCLDHLKRKQIERRATELVDPLPGSDWELGEPAGDPERTAILREDLRFAVMVALQRLSPRQRAALILHDVCDRSTAEIAETLGTNANAAKALLHRARVALSKARRFEEVDAPVDRGVVEAFARAIEAGSIEALTELLATDAWGIVDWGLAAAGSRKPTYGRRAISRQWANAKRRLGQPVTSELHMLNGEPAIFVRLTAAPEHVVAVIHLETRDRRVLALRVNRDLRRIAAIFAYPSAAVDRP